MSFEWSLKGYTRNDNAVGAHRPSLFVRLRTLVVSGIFLVTLFFAVEKRVTGSKGFESKTIMRTPRGMMARSVLLIFYKELKHALPLTAIH
jgi:hypothetical protein